MATQEAVNTFEGGLNKDVSKKALPANMYSDARNVSISGVSDEFAMKGIEGSIQNTLLDATETDYGDTTIMAIVECNILHVDNDPDNSVPGFAYITQQTHNSLALGLIKVFLHVTSTGFNMKIYEVGYNSDDYDHPDSISAFAFAEGSQDYIYFTDTARFIRKIPCIIDPIKTYDSTSHNDSGGFLQLVFLGTDLTTRFKVGDDVACDFTDTYSDNDYEITAISWNTTSTSMTLDLAYTSGPTIPTTITFPGGSYSDIETRLIPQSVTDLVPYGGTFTSASHSDSGGIVAIVFDEDLTDLWVAGDEVDVTFADTYTSGIYDVVSVTSLTGSSSSLKIQLAWTGSPTGDSTVTGQAANVRDGGGTKGAGLLYGSYDVYMRLVNGNTSKASDWNLMKDRMHVPLVRNIDQEDGSVGTISQNYISVSVQITDEMNENYTGIQTATVERTQGISTYQTARLTPVGDITGIIVGDTYTIDIDSNNLNNLISISDLVIDNASIETAETIATKNNRLIAGGITYKGLTNNSSWGETTLDTSTITSEVVLGGTEPGYFRGETYRFGVAYFNEDGVFGPVQALDFTGVSSTHNKTDFGTDFRFPARTDDHTWSIFRNDTDVANLALNIGQLKYHPTWAKGFVIVRARRKKNILFQTPLIPSVLVQAGIAFGGFPVLDTATDAYTATPADPDGTWMPKNFFRPWNYSIEQYPTTFGFPKGYGVSYMYTGAPDGRVKDMTTFAVFDSNYMYDVDTPYTFRATDNVEIQDIALLKMKLVDFGTSPNPVDSKDNPGNYLRTEIAGQWYAPDGGHYFVSDDNTYSGTPTFNFEDSVTESKIADYQTMSNYGEKITISKAGTTPGWGNSSNSFGGYAELQPDGLNEGVTPNNQKMGVLCTESLMPDASHYCATTNNSPHYFAHHGFGPTHVLGVSGASHLTIPTLASGDANDFLTALNQTNNAVAIANITAGLDDARYGDMDEYHEYISTGYVYRFSAAELIDVAADTPFWTSIGRVMGGDCWITPHTFKLTDGHYSVANVDSSNTSPWADDIERWEKVFANGPNEIQRSNALDKVSQTVTVFLESTVKASVQNGAVYNATEAAVRWPALGLTYPFPSEVSEIKTSFLYDYSSDFSVEGDGRVYLPSDFTTKTNREFPSRLVYSNQKIYQSFEEGFDKYPVLNFYDLEERYGAVANLHTFKDRLYAFQEDAISYIPVDKQVVETADGIGMSLQSGAIIGTPIFSSTYYGSSLATNVLSTDKAMYVIDRNRGAILTFDGQTVNDLSAQGMEEFFSQADYTNIAYDYSRKELIVYDRVGTADGTVLKYRPVIFSEKTKGWVSEYDGLAGDYIGLAWQSSDTTGGLLAMSRVTGGDDITVHDMYENLTTSVIFGNNVAPYVTYVVNEDILNVKTFDTLALYADAELAESTLSTSSPQQNQSVTAQLNVADREGVYRVKTLRDKFGARVRNVYADIKIEWNPLIISNLSHALTKYRISNRKLKTDRKSYVTK